MSEKPEYPQQADAPELAELNRLLAEGLRPITLSPEQAGAMRERLMARVAHSVTEHAGMLTVRRKDGIWRNLKKGIRIKPLWSGPEGNSVLIELAPGTALPVHRHNWVEEGIVLRGDLQIGELELRPFDYQISIAGSRHNPIRSRQGALAFLRGTSLGRTLSVISELLRGLLPPYGGLTQTVFTDTGEWVEVAQGVLKKELWSNGVVASRFFRLAPGARLDGHRHALDEECMLLSGEVFLGDLLLCDGDYQLAPAGSWHGEIYSDVGALIFVRGSADP